MNNTWAAFNGLTNSKTMKIVEVVGHSGGETVVKDSNNNQFRVPGADYPAGAKVYLQNGLIVSIAMTLIDAGTFWV